jgi:PAS domain S-box-containing protein
MSSSGPLRILVMEDDAGQARLAQRALERAGYLVDVTYDGETGLAMFQSGAYDALIIDHEMPGKAGIEVLHTLAAWSNLSPTIMVTDQGAETLAVEAMKLGVGDYIIKDVDGSYLTLLPIVVERLFKQQRLAEAKQQAEEALQQTLLELENRVRARTADLQRSEALNRGIVNTAIDGIITIDEAGLIASFNLAAERLFGYRADEVIGRNVAMLMPSPYREEHDSYLARYLLTREPRIIGIGREVSGQRKDGTTFPMDLAVGATLVDTRHIFTGIVRDITNRKQAEEALRESQRTLSTLMSNLPGMAYRCYRDRRWTMQFVSQGSLELTGYHPYEIVENQSVSYEHIIHPDDREMVWNDMRAAIEHQKPFQLTYRIIAADGKEKWVWEQGREVVSADGNHALEGFITDITERQHAAQEMQRADRLALVGQLASGLAHEIGTPLNVIAGNAELLGMDLRAHNLPTETTDAIVRQTDRITGLVQQLLTFARSKAQEMGPCSLNEPLLHALRLLENRLQREGITTVLNIPDHLPRLWGAADQIEQVFLNVLVNAWHAMPAGGTITVQAFEIEHQRVRVTFSDTGVGMATDHLEKSFEPFYSTKGEKGTGLGLAICRQIIENHRGHIRLDSAVGVGTTVIIDFLQADTMGPTQANEPIGPIA